VPIHLYNDCLSKPSSVKLIDMVREPRPKKTQTIRDVANYVGVHHSTVSRALNPDQRGKVSPAVAREIERAAEKLGYFPNIAASSLKRNKSFVVGVLIPDITNPVFPPIIRGLQDVAEAGGYTVITTSTDDDPDKERNAFKIMRGRSIDGIIIATALLDDPIVEKCISDQIPFVLVNRTVGTENVNAILVDEEFGVRAALDHLLELGHTRIAHVAGQQHSSTGVERLRAFRDYMKVHDLDPGLVSNTKKYTIAEGFAACEALLRRASKFTAILAGNDLIAMGCIDALNKAGKRVPEDISIVGGNDIPFLSRMVPALTTNRIPTYEMGSQAAASLLELIDGSVRNPVVIRMQPKLIVRGSTGPV
jgi:LacI family transcriptional regulator